jgi:thioredoxin reductase
MKNKSDFDIIIIGGSYSGLAAGLASGRALRRVLIIDSGQPCNRQAPYSHNFITQDGKTPEEISTLAREQVGRYETVTFYNGLATNGAIAENGFDIITATKEKFSGKKLVFATGIRDIMPNIEGYSECWGISVLHCPYCHGYEVKNNRTGILGNGEYGFEFSNLISNWTKDLTLFTNGPSALTSEQTAKVEKHRIKIIEKEIVKLEHCNGYIQGIIFNDGTDYPVKALYARSPFKQHCTLPESLGCEMTDQGYIKTDIFQKTSVKGIFASGDNSTRIRNVANAVAMGTIAGMTANKEIIEEEF